MTKNELAVQFISHCVTSYRTFILLQALNTHVKLRREAVDNENLYNINYSSPNCKMFKHNKIPCNYISSVDSEPNVTLNFIW